MKLQITGTMACICYTHCMQVKLHMCVCVCSCLKVISRDMSVSRPTFFTRCTWKSCVCMSRKMCIFHASSVNFTVCMSSCTKTYMYVCMSSSRLHKHQPPANQLLGVYGTERADVNEEFPGVDRHIATVYTRGGRAKLSPYDQMADKASELRHLHKLATVRGRSATSDDIVKLTSLAVDGDVTSGARQCTLGLLDYSVHLPTPHPSPHLGSMNSFTTVDAKASTMGTDRRVTGAGNRIHASDNTCCRSLTFAGTRRTTNSALPMLPPDVTLYDFCIGPSCTSPP